MALQRKHWIGIAVVIALTAIAVIIAVVATGDDAENIETVQVNEDVMQASQLRTGELNALMSSVARGNLTVLQEDATIVLEMTNFAASPCSDLELYFSPTAEPTSIATLDVFVPVPANSTFRVEAPASFDAETTEGFALWCASSTTLLGNGEFSALAMVAEPIVSSGTFDGLTGHTVEGQISITQTIEFVDGEPVTRYALLFEDLVVDEGPDLFLYLTTNPNPEDVSAPGSVRVELDDIRFFAKEGTFTQDLDPSITDPTIFQGANVWCDAFSVAFGRATLSFSCITCATS